MEETPPAAAILRAFDPRPLYRRAKVILTLIGAVGLLALGALEIIAGRGSPEVLERIVTWVGLVVGVGTGGVALDDARTKPILARALERVINPPEVQ
jgi:hypothetical protein